MVDAGVVVGAAVVDAAVVDAGVGNSSVVGLDSAAQTPSCLQLEMYASFMA